MAPVPQLIDPQQNLMIRQGVLMSTVPMLQQLDAFSVSNYIVGQATTVRRALRNVGLTRRLFITIDATVVQAAAETLTATTFNAANVLSNVTFSDFSNVQRINTTGWHLDALATRKRRGPAFSAYTTSNPVKTGAIFNVKSAPTTITTAQHVYMTYEIPFAFTQSDLRGAIMTQVTNGNAYLEFTINPNFIVSSTANPVEAVYQSSTSGDRGLVTNLNITIYQDYLDQLPQDQKSGTYILPPNDLATQYGLYNTVQGGLSANSDNPYSFVNYRSYFSAFNIYDNAGVLNAGSDINQWKLQAANQTQIFSLPPWMVKVRERDLIGDDYPAGSYWLDFSDKPIETRQNGNMQILLNPSTVTSAATAWRLGLEYLGLQSQLAQAGSVLV